MPVDYDLIILGATPAGIEAAIAAAALKARVALVTQNISPARSEALKHHSLLEIAHQIERLEQMRSLPLWASPLSPNALQQGMLKPWVDAVVANVGVSQSATVLAQRGVDVIFGLGEFCRKPASGLMIDRRFIQARAYLLATDSCWLMPPIAGLESVGYLTSFQSVDDLPSRLLILGSGKTAIELAQTSIRLGREATLVVQGSLLPDADLEAVRLLQAQLEVEGVRVLTDTKIARVRPFHGSKQIQVNDQILEVDEIIVAAEQAPDVASLNLAAVGVRWNSHGIWHNAKLQTTNPRIYACEGRVGDECWAGVAAYEATIALKNALFFPVFKVSYCTVPLTVHTAPELAWIGLTEAAAVEQYGKKVCVLRRSFNTLPRAQMQNDLVGFCKLIVHRNGDILGAHLVGAQASETIGVIALAMQQKLKIGAIASLNLPFPTLAEILPQIAIDFRSSQLRQHRLQDLLDNFFDLRRAWSKP